MQEIYQLPGRVAVVGLGLIGGSIAKALKYKLQIPYIIGVDEHIQNVNGALEDGVIQEGYTQIDAHLAGTEVAFLCVDVAYITSVAKELAAAAPNCLMSDVGSVKREILQEINSMKPPVRFVGGHPMAGTEGSGYSASHVDMLENACYVLIAGAHASAGDVEMIRFLASRMGALPVEMDAASHDRTAAAISHVPHVVAAALVNMVAKGGESFPQAFAMAAGGFRDMTRIASSSSKMWEQVCGMNLLAVNEGLDALISQLQAFQYALNTQDTSAVYHYFAEAKACRDSL